MAFVNAGLTVALSSAVASTLPIASCINGGSLEIHDGGAALVIKSKLNFCLPHKQSRYLPA
jgi:hypothetical protein